MHLLLVSFVLSCVPVYGKDRTYYQIIVVWFVVRIVFLFQGCFNCGGDGHIARECPEERSKES